jgi:hypothetical protein
MLLRIAEGNDFNHPVGVLSRRAEIPRDP